MRCLPWGPWATAWLAAREPSTCGRSCQKVSSMRDGSMYHWRGRSADGVGMHCALPSVKPRSQRSHNAGSAGPPCSLENCVCLHTHGP